MVTKLWLVPIIFGSAFISQAAAPPAALQISNSTAPAGGWAQIQIYAVKPMNIASGNLVLHLDATAFGAGATAGLFGANGDATGMATTTGSQIDIQFSSASGGIGALAGVPVLVVSVPVLPSATGTVAVTAASPDGSVSVASGSVTVQGTLSVQNIPAGMGVIPAGTLAPLYGTGFTAATKVTIDGVVIAATQFVSAQEMDVTIGGATELVGKRARVVDSGVEFDYFCFQPNAPANFPENTFPGSQVTNIQPLFPLFAATGLSSYNGYLGSVVEVQNPNPAANTVTITNIEFAEGPTQVASQDSLTVPPGSWAIFDGNAETSFVLNATLPVRVVFLGFDCLGPTSAPCLETPAVTPSTAFRYPPVVLTPSSLALEWQTGSPLPAARTVSLGFDPGLYPPSIMASSTASWLSVQVTQSNVLSVTVDPLQLTAGTYQGSVTVAQSYGSSATLPVILTVTNAPVPVISANPTNLTFSAANSTAPPSTQTISLTSNAGPAAFSVSLSPGTGTLVQVSPMSGITPATLNVTWNPAETLGNPAIPPSILISGPANTITIPLTFNFTGVQAVSETGINGLVFSAQTGSAPQTQTIDLSPSGTISATVNQPWISAAVQSNIAVTVTANPAGLSPGVYNGTVTVSEPGLTSLTVPVTLGVWTTAPPLSIGTGSFTFIQIVGEPGPPVQTAEVESGGVPVPFTILNGTSWLSVADPFNAPSPTQITIGVAAPEPVVPGQYLGSFTLQSPGGSVYAPVTLLVEPGPLAPPVLSQVVNAASEIAAGVSPGEIVSVRGYAVGASAVSGYKLNASGLVETNLNGLQVTFDGQLAPLLYTSANQTNLIVPYEVTGKTSTVIQVTYQAASGTLQTASWVLPVVGSAPGIFTLDATGTGPGAILNQDGSVNSASNPAIRGTVVSIYATGEGQTTPSGVTGSVTQSNTQTPLLPVTVTIGGIEAIVQYAGSAPDEIAGMLQVNVVAPPGVTPGPAVPVIVSVGGMDSQAGVTMAVQ